MYACAETLPRVRLCARARLCLCDDLGTYSKTNKRTPFLNNLALLCSYGASPVGSSGAFSIIGRFGHQSSPEAKGLFAGRGLISAFFFMTFAPYSPQTSYQKKAGPLQAACGWRLN